jgi:hypothetical protein
MPTYNSKDGVWFAATERVALYDKNGDPHIYDGPCRAATEYLKEVGEETLGMHFSQDPEIIDRAHERRMSIEQFCKTSINTDEKREAAFKEAASKKVNHKLPERKPMTKAGQSGGSNTAGGAGSLEGGFTESQGDPLTEAVSKVKAKSK